MAEKLCTLRTKGGGGGKYTETSLWTNPSPTSSYSGGDVTLSESVEQYKYIKIKCRVSSSNAGTFSTIYSVDDLKTFMANSVPSGCGHIAIYDSSNNRHSRGIQYKDSTTINIKVAYQDGTTTQNNANCIPIEILGLNELATGHKMDDTILWTNASPTSSFSAQTITLSENMTVYDYIKIVYEYSNSTTTKLCQVLIPMSDFVTYKADSSPSGVGNLGVINSSNGSAARSFWYVSETKVGFGAGYMLASTSANNTICIPVNIIGCKLS